MDSLWTLAAIAERMMSSLGGTLATKQQHNRMARMLNPSNGLILAYSMALILILLGSSGKALVECHEQQLEVVSREQKDNGDSSLSATIDYLEKLDKYYSQIARPRFGRSGGGVGPNFGQLLGGGPRSASIRPERLAQSELRLLEILANQLARKNKELAY